MITRQLLLFYILLITITWSIAIDNRIPTYETINVNLVSNSVQNERRYEFDAFGRQFRLLVRPISQGLFHSNFRQFSDSSNGLVEDFDTVDFDDHLQGRVIGFDYSSVVLTRMPDGSFTGKISVDGEEYHLEPVQRFAIDSIEKGKTIIYRDRDLISSINSTQIDFLRPIARSSENPRFENDFRTFLRRFRRETKPIEDEKRNRCSLKIVVDFKFFTRIGKSNRGITTRYVVNLIARVNEIFTRVNWDEGKEHMIEERGRFHNMGFSIKEIKILEKESVNDYQHYNREQNHGKGRAEVWTADDLLEQFSNYEATPDFCLVHLLTAQSFSGSAAIGLAYVANADSGRAISGICSRESHQSRKASNTLLTSAWSNTGTHDYPLVTREEEIVLAHEFGHAWGSNHDAPDNSDPDTLAECMPSFKDGGNFIMHAYSQRGYDDNNNKFSPCSRRAIRKVLQRRWDLCFEEEKASFCGNGVVEDGEQCDEGGQLSLSKDAKPSSVCCTRDCKLIPSAVCSPSNHPCCTPMCQFHNSSHVCLKGNQWQCKGAAFCSGNSGECPKAPPAKNGERCIEEGECRDGTCFPYCERSDIGKKSCICEKLELSCKRCCQALNSTECLPEIGASDLRDGTWCAQGVCKKSKCVNEVADYVKLYFGALYEPSEFGAFLRKNIVGIIVILSIMVWCPISWWICKVDKNKSRSAFTGSKVRMAQRVVPAQAQTDPAFS